MDVQLVQQAFQASQVEIINVHQFYPSLPKPTVINPDGKRITSFLGNNTGPLRQDEQIEETREDEVPRQESTVSGSSVQDSESGLKKHFSGYLETADEILDRNVANYVGETQRCLQSGTPQRALDFIGRALNLRPRRASLYELRAEVYFRLQDYTSAIKSYKKALQLQSQSQSQSQSQLSGAGVARAARAREDERLVALPSKAVLNEGHLMSVRSTKAAESGQTETGAGEQGPRLNKQRLSLFYFMYAQSLFDVKRYVEALEAYSSAVALEPDCVFYHVSCMSCLVALRRTTEALSVANRLIEDGYRTADMFLLRARLLRLFKNYTASFQDVQAALRLAPEHVVARALCAQQRDEARQNVVLADELTIKQRFKEALQHMSLAIEMDPSVIEYHLKRGVIYRHLRDHNAAIDSFMTAMSRTDSAAAELSTVHVPRAVAHVTIPSENSQLESLTGNANDQSRALVPLVSSATAPTRAVDSAASEYENEKVEREKQVALLAQRQLILTYSDFAVDCLQKGFCSEGVLLLNKAIKVEKQEKGLYVNRGDCFFKMLEYNFALADYEQALELDPNDLEVKRRIAVVYGERAKQLLADGKQLEAIAMLGKAIEFTPLEASMYAMRANAYYTQQAILNAQQDTVLALLIDPRNDKLIDFAIKLFSKQSVTEVLQSRVGEQMKAKYRELVAISQQKVAVERQLDLPGAVRSQGRYSDNALVVAGVYQHLAVPSHALRVSSATVVNRLTSDLASTVVLAQDADDGDVDASAPNEKQNEANERVDPTESQPAETQAGKEPEAETDTPIPTRTRKPRKARSVDSDVLLVLRKKTIEDRVKHQYLERGNLWPRGPRIVPTESTSETVTSKPKQPQTGWRKFSRGIKA